MGFARSRLNGVWVPVRMRRARLVRETQSHDDCGATRRGDDIRREDTSREKQRRGGSGVSVCYPFRGSKSESSATLLMGYGVGVGECVVFTKTVIDAAALVSHRARRAPASTSPRRGGHCRDWLFTPANIGTLTSARHIEVQTHFKLNKGHWLYSYMGRNFMFITKERWAGMTRTVRECAPDVVAKPLGRKGKS